MITFLTLVFILVAVLLTLVVLVQRGNGGGLAGAFGSGGGSTSAFGTKTGDVFTWLTVVLFVIFMVLSIWLNMDFRDTKEVIAGGLTTQESVVPPAGTPPAASGTNATPAPAGPATPAPATPATPPAPAAQHPAETTPPVSAPPAVTTPKPAPTSTPAK